MAYFREKFWEKETPREVFTGRIALAYFEEAGKLQVSLLYVDGDGENKRGKTVTLDAEDMQLHPVAVDVIKSFLAGIDD